MTEELDSELQARLEAAADRIAPKADRLDQVQHDGATRQERRKRVVSVSALVLFVAALGGGAFALTTIGDDPQQVLAAQVGDGTESPEGTVPPSDDETDGTPGSAMGDGQGDGAEGEPADGATTTETTTPATGSVTTTVISDGSDPSGGTASTTGLTGTTIYDEDETTVTTEGSDGSSPTTGQSDEDPVTVTTIPLPPDADRQSSWDYRYDFGAVQQWATGNQDCIRLYSPIKRDPARSEDTIMQQSTFEACFNGVTTVDDWYVAPGGPPHMLFLLYALPPLDPVAVWVTDASGYRVPGFVDGEFWGIDAYWSSKPVAVHIQRSSGEVVSLDLPEVSKQSNILRLYIGRQVTVG